MEKDIFELNKKDYFKNEEDIFIQKSDNYDFNGVTHSHNFIELSFVVSGSAVHTINDTSYTVKKGNLVIIDYQVPHSFSFDPTSDEGFVTYDLLFTPDFYNISALKGNDFYSLISSYLFSPIFAEFSVEPSYLNLVRTSSREIRSILEKMLDEYTKRNKGFQSLLRAYLIELIIVIFREIEKNQPTFTESQQDMVEKAIAYMQENFKSSITLDDIVSGIFFSKDYFRQVFKKTTGTSITSYIQDLRITEACRLLEHTTDSSSEIAAKCGFNDVKFFYQTFKKKLGMTPAEYRNEKLSK